MKKNCLFFTLTLFVVFAFILAGCVSPETPDSDSLTAESVKNTLCSGSWRVDPNKTPDCYWDEIWTFHKDGTYEDWWSEEAYQEYYKGFYTVTQADDGFILYQKVTHSKENATADYIEMEAPMEFWYTIKSIDMDGMYLECTKSNYGAGELPHNPPIPNYYKREAD